jgi:hypothetical protein
VFARFELIIPPDLVTVPPAAIEIPVPLLNVPEFKLRLVIVVVDVVIKLTLALESVSVPNAPPIKPTSDGNVPAPSIIIVDEAVVEISPGVAGP